MASHVVLSYRGALQKELARCNMNHGQVAAILSEFDKGVRRGDAKAVFAGLMEFYGSCDTKRTVSEVEKCLINLNSEHEGIDRNPCTRTATYVTRHNTMVSKLACDIVDDKGNTRTIVGADQPRLQAKFLPKSCFTHTCNAGGKTYKLDLEVIV